MATRIFTRSLLSTKQALSSALSRSYASLCLSTPPSSLSTSSVLRLRPLVAVAAHFHRLSPASTTVRGFSTRQTTSSLNDPNPNWTNRPPKETILLDGCDFEHWLVVMEKPEGEPTRDDIIDSYIKTLAKVVGSEEEARMKIYSVSTRHYFAFGALVSEEVSYKIKELPGVRWVLPDSYLDVRNKDYGGEPFINGQAVPYDPKYHEEWVRNNARANERNRRNDRPRNFDRSRNFERRRENMQNRDFQPQNPGSNTGGFPPGNTGSAPNVGGMPGQPNMGRMPPGNTGGPNTGGFPPGNTGSAPNVGGMPGQPNMGGTQPNYGGGQPNMGGTQPNYGGGQPNMGGTQPNYGGGQPNMGGTQPNYGGGQPNMGGTQPSYVGGQPNMGRMQQNNMGGGAPNMGPMPPNNIRGYPPNNTGGMPPNNMGGGAPYNAGNFQNGGGPNIGGGPNNGGMPFQNREMPGPGQYQHGYSPNPSGGNPYQTQNIPGRDNNQ
ncbi:multiple organellar RNA editing factor 8, chloroplastic/mitochondrial-like [Actinidia eriantha]|uniref:multiple organellar RNA editing factor 8, chloroplastic/mitochondrial-like n=1 Tax=Actinidia eriantha TaxID=165200 RepID=UPI002587DBC1|nr:multiple organellar RNA editing factor 8, chloroplastic/mitochondrial-like [Actinidia eriantha]